MTAVPITRLSPVSDDPADALTLGELARDPSLIAGIYDVCDQWCMYCPATARCLAFRGSKASDLNVLLDPGRAPAEWVDEGVLFMKALAEAERRVAPPEIEAVFSTDPNAHRAVFRLDDPLERLGGSYMALAEAYVISRPDLPHENRWRPEGPTPLEMLAWYHALVPSRVFRAILCASEAQQGRHDRQDDALGAAKMALIGIDRSFSALAAVMTEDDDARLPLLTERLRRLRDAVEARFPAARAYVRAGLDREAPLGRVPRAGRGLQALLRWWRGSSHREGRPPRTA